MEVGHWLGARTLAEVKDLAARELTLAGVVEKIKPRMLFVNSRYDTFFDFSDLDNLTGRATAPFDTIIFDTSVHGGPPSLSWPAAADWLADQFKT
jgi:hypothetical protein